MEKSAATSSPAISLPKGGGAVQGIGETFQPSLFSGTGNFHLPISTSSGRDGFGPQLSLQYSTGNGNGIFGLGWKLSIPRISRKTEKGLPRYTDDDVFVLSGAEDLVPKLISSDPQVVDREIVPDESFPNPLYFRVTRYLPRTEGLFARIESWETLDPGDTRPDDDPHHNVIDVFWRVTTKENVTSIYGRTAAARIADPKDASKIFEWLLEETFDSKGNHISYEYACDDSTLDLPESHEQNRVYAQIYPRRILYGNVPEVLVDFNGNQFSAGVTRSGTDHRNIFSAKDRRYVYEVIFNYGDWIYPQGNTDQFIYQAAGVTQEKFTNGVPIRNDAFSSFRPGFELRTMRQCRSVFMVHHFKELGGATLVKSSNFDYHESSGTGVSLLICATVTGYRKTSGTDYVFDSMPPVEFSYSEFRPKEQKYQSVKAKAGDMPAVSLNDPNTSLVDIFGNGLQDIVQSTSAGFRYWRNQGNGNLDTPNLLQESPAGLALADAGVSFGDMGGDGLADLIVTTGPMSGFFELQAEHEVSGERKGGWSHASFKHYDKQPVFSLSDPNLRMLDLTGDGLTDLLVTTDREFHWYQSNGEKGYAQQPAELKPAGLESLSFNDPFRRVRLADMSGDGLKDIVLIDGQSIGYWPNLGYGAFGQKLTMGGETLLPLDFDPKRLFLADLDGSGTSDLVYVDFNKVHFWLNQSGNRWSDQQTIDGTPITVDSASLAFTDFFGTGTTSLLWSYNFGTFADGNYKVLDFCGGNKPYLLSEMSNNLGATTRVRYASSTKFYLEDVARGDYWATPLPFPVHVLEKSESIDHISKTKLVTCYKYHHGFYDGREREFRGFGRVDQIDTETFDIFKKKGLHEDSSFDNNNEAHHVPPVETRTWFHTGAYFEQRDILDVYRAEYFGGVEELDAIQKPQDAAAFDLGGHDVQIADNDSVIEAHRALRGSVLRTEVYAHDSSEDTNFPYMVSEQTYRVQTKQSTGENAHAVFLATVKDSIRYHYERKHSGRNLVDPRIQHHITIAVDEFGNPTQTANIAYKRRQTNHAEQDTDLLTVSTNSYVLPLTSRDDFRHSAAVTSKVYELTGAKRPVTNAYSAADLSTAFANAANIAYEQKTTAGQVEKRQLKHQTTVYWNDDLSDSAPIAVVAYHGLPFETYQRALTPSLRTSIYGSTRLSNSMGAEGGYREKSGDKWITADQGDWWIPSGNQLFDPAMFFLATQVSDPFGNTTTVQYDPYHLFPVKITDPLNNTQEGLIDYRLLQPYLARDMNGNYSELAFNALGLVVGTAVMGKAGRDPAQSLLGIDDVGISQMRSNTEADSLAGFESELTDSQVTSFLTDPDGVGQPAYSASAIRVGLEKATTRMIYDLHRYQRDAKPVRVCAVTRETHDKGTGNSSAIQLSYAYSDGFNREVQKKIQAEPGSGAKRRWVTSGWTVFNNKGKPVQQFEPYFSDTLDFEPDNKIGVSSTLFYDPLERVVCTLYANQTYEKVVFDPWQQASWDVNDTVLLEPQNDPDIKHYVEKYVSTLGSFSSWFHQRVPDPANPPTSPTDQQRAALKTIEHANTPSLAYLTVQGEVFLSVDDNKAETLQTTVSFDVEGNDLDITDPRGIKVFTHAFDMAGRKLRIASADVGDAYRFLTVDDKPLYNWDANGNRVGTSYDNLRRTQSLHVTKPDGTLFLAQQLIYGESRPLSEASNSRGSVWKQYDGAGLAINERIYFNGKVLEAHRKLLLDGKLTTPEWPIDSAGNFDEAAANSMLETSTRLNGAAYTRVFSYDALNRITQIQLPDGTIQIPTYNYASLLESLSVQHPGQSAKAFVSNIDYNAKGQREQIAYQNGVVETYSYEPDTFRLQSVDSIRTGPVPKHLQQLRYCYDPAGNIMSIRDDAHASVFNQNQVIEAESRYTYDPVYRLIEASGREHEAMSACHYQQAGNKHAEFLLMPQSTANSQALINYIEKYQYDKSSNISQTRHTNSLRTTTRSQAFDSQSNRLTSSKSGCNNETLAIPHDANGNVTQLPHLPSMVWNFKNQLEEVELNVGANPNKSYYQYDGQGQRIRKTIVKNNGNDVSERIYLGDYEIYIEKVANSIQKHRDTIHVNNDQGRVVIIESEKNVINPSSAISTTIRYQLSNILESVSLELDETGQIISYEEYYPYGGSSYIAGRNQTETSSKRYRYSGKERDDETGLYYYGARYYAPWLQRWIAPDPAGVVDGHNLYQFVRSNPTRLKDSDGMSTDDTPPPDPSSKVTVADPPANHLPDIKDPDANSGNLPVKASDGSAINPSTGEPWGKSDKFKTKKKRSWFDKLKWKWKQSQIVRSLGLSTKLLGAGTMPVATEPEKRVVATDQDVIDKQETAKGGKTGTDPTPDKGSEKKIREAKGRKIVTDTKPKSVTPPRPAEVLAKKTKVPSGAMTKAGAAADVLRKGKPVLMFAGDRVLKAIPIGGAIYVFATTDGGVGWKLTNVVAGEIGVGPVDLQFIGEAIGYTGHLIVLGFEEYQTYTPEQKEKYWSNAAENVRGSKL